MVGRQGHGSHADGDPITSLAPPGAMSSPGRSNSCGEKSGALASPVHDLRSKLGYQGRADTDCLYLPWMWICAIQVYSALTGVMGL